MRVYAKSVRAGYDIHECTHVVYASVTASHTSHKYDGTTMLAAPTPKPTMKRPTIRTSYELASASIQEPMVKTPDEIRTIGRLPYRSAISPDAIAEHIAPRTVILTIRPYGKVWGARNGADVNWFNEIDVLSA